jgi:hypothetical protein
MKRLKDCDRMAQAARTPSLVNLRSDGTILCSTPFCGRPGVSGGWREVPGSQDLNSYALCRACWCRRGHAKE